MATLPKPLSQEWSAQQRQLAQLRESGVIQSRLTQQNPHRRSTMTHESIFSLKELRKDVHLLLLRSPSPVDLNLLMAFTALGTAVAIAIRPHSDLDMRGASYKQSPPRRMPILEDEDLEILLRVQADLKARVGYAPLSVAEYLDRALEWIDKGIAVANQQRDRFDWTLHAESSQRSDNKLS